MPFTVSHTITAVPLRRLLGRRAVPSALVIGAMVPDFRLLVPGLQNLETHSPAALLWFALPVGVATYVVFHALLRAPALALLPSSVRRRMGQLLRAPKARPGFEAVALCVVLGAASHLLWDEFTHRQTFVVEYFYAFFVKLLWRRGRAFIYVYTVIQLASSVVGLALLAEWCRRWLARQPVDETVGRAGAPWERALGVALVLGAPLATSVVRFVKALPRVEWVGMAVWAAVRASCMAFAAGGLVFALVWRLRHGREVA